MADSITHISFLNLLATWWTPAFVALSASVLIYVLRPRNRAMFDEAAKMPLRED